MTGSGASLTLAEDFDTFLLGDLGMFVNIDFESLKGQDDAAARLLKPQRR